MLAAALRASSLDASDEAGEAARRTPQDELPSCQLDHDAAGPLISEEVRVPRGGHIFSGSRGARPGHLVPPPFCIKSLRAISVTPEAHGWCLELAVAPSCPLQPRCGYPSPQGAEPSVGVMNSSYVFLARRWVSAQPLPAASTVLSEDRDLRPGVGAGCAGPPACVLHWLCPCYSVICVKKKRCICEIRNSQE